jgi:hypothetical protein
MQLLGGELRSRGRLQGACPGSCSPGTGTAPGSYTASLRANCARSMKLKMMVSSWRMRAERTSDSARLLLVSCGMAPAAGLASAAAGAGSQLLRCWRGAAGAGDALPAGGRCCRAGGCGGRVAAHRAACDGPMSVCPRAGGPMGGRGAQGGFDSPAAMRLTHWYPTCALRSRKLPSIRLQRDVAAVLRHRRSWPSIIALI